MRDQRRNYKIELIVRIIDGQSEYRFSSVRVDHVSLRHDERHAH
jgi:hypothetical protein